MKKVYALPIFGLAVSLYMAFTVHNIFNHNNERSMKGEYISDVEQYNNIAYKINQAKQLINPIARELELQDLNKLQRALAEPAKPLNEVDWLLENKTICIITIVLFLSSMLEFFYTFTANNEEHKQKRKKQTHEKLPIKCIKESKNELSLTEKFLEQ